MSSAVHAPERPRYAALGLLLAGAWPSLAALIYLVWLPGRVSATVVQGVYGALKVVQFGLPLVWVRCVERKRLSVPRPHRRGLPLGIGFGLAVGIAALGLYFGGLNALLDFARLRARSKLLRFAEVYLELAVILAVFHSLLEEYYWRWFYFDLCRRAFSLRLAVLVSGLAFAAHHVILLANFVPLAWALLFALGVWIGGMFWAWLYQRTGSLLAPWISHMIVDMAFLTIGYFILFSNWKSDI